jgi:hypothetical protein
MPAGRYRKIDTEKQESLPSLVCMEPAIVPIQGVHPARVLTRVQTRSPTADVTTRLHR